MRTEKWIQIWKEECDKYEQKYFKIEVHPANWAEAKGILMGLIEAMDKATEIYDKENANGN